MRILTGIHAYVEEFTYQHKLWTEIRTQISHIKSHHSFVFTRESPEQICAQMRSHAVAFKFRIHDVNSKTIYFRISHTSCGAGTGNKFAREFREMQIHTQIGTNKQITTHAHTQISA